MELSADDLLARALPPKGAAAVAVIDAEGDVSIAGHRGGDVGLYEVGSITKTMTATLLATLVLDGAVSLDTTVRDILGSAAGATAEVSLRQLATHTSGLPRLAPNAYAMPFWPRDPYRAYTPARLLRGLTKVEIGEGAIAYSNFGYQLLGHSLSVAATAPFKELLEQRVLAPAGMVDARCQPCPSRGLHRGRGGHWIIGGRRWHERLAGPGGVDCTITDLARWARSNLLPDSTPLGPAIRLAQQVHATDDERRVGLAWHFGREALWHNGATGSFQSVVALRPGFGAACGLAAFGPGRAYAIDRPVVEALSG